VLAHQRRKGFAEAPAQAIGEKGGKTK